MQAPNVLNQAEAGINLKNHHSLIKVQNTFFHKFSTENQRELLDICQSEILQHINVQGTQMPSHVLKMGSFIQKMEEYVFVKFTFQNLTTFAFQDKVNANTIYLISLETYNPDLQYFTQVFKESANLVQYNTDNYEKTEIKQKITLICGELTQEMITTVGSLNTVLTTLRTVGNIFGVVSKSVVGPALGAQNLILTSVGNISDNYVSDANRGRWNTVKQTAYNLNQKMTQVYKPIDNAFKMIANTISNSFVQSQNKYVQGLLKYGKATAKTLNSSYIKAQRNIVRNMSEPNATVTRPVSQSSQVQLKM